MDTLSNKFRNLETLLLFVSAKGKSECVKMRFRSIAPALERSPVSVTSYLYKLCGSSQPAIVRGSDGGLYVVKFQGVPGHQALANEVVGAALIKLIGLPTPDWSPIAISRDFINEHPEMWFIRDGGDSIKPPSGLHFGSRLIEAGGNQRTYQMIPHSWIDRIEDRANFLGILALDLWANNCDRRQAVFISDVQKKLHAKFIDNDYMFGGRFGGDITCPRRAMVYDLDVYRDIWTEGAVRKWIEVINGIADEAIHRIISTIPDEWASSSTRQDILTQLCTRRYQLPRLLNEARDVASNGHSVQYHRTRHATEPGQVWRSVAGPQAGI